MRSGCPLAVASHGRAACGTAARSAGPVTEYSSASSCVKFKSYDAVTPLQAETILKYSADKRVRHVEGKIPDATAIGEIFQMIVIAHEITVRIARVHLFENPFLAHFENARRRDPNCALRRRAAAARNEPGHGLAIFFWVFKFAVERLRAAFEGSLQVAARLRTRTINSEPLKSRWMGRGTG